MTASATLEKTTVSMAEVRTWAARKGLRVNASGNISQEIVDAYNRAHRAKQFLRGGRGRDGGMERT